MRWTSIPAGSDGISGRTTWTWNFRASVPSDVTVVAGPRRLAEGDVEYSTIPPVFFVCINGNNDVLVLGSPCLKMREGHEFRVTVINRKIPRYVVSIRLRHVLERINSTNSHKS